MMSYVLRPCSSDRSGLGHRDLSTLQVYSFSKGAVLRSPACPAPCFAD